MVGRCNNCIYLCIDPEEWPPERRRQVQAEYRSGRDDRQVTA